jgi:cell division septation protein DedD
LASHTQDDGFHEIQLNGKQLVFLFMAATVVSVVIFLCGVLVGRGVRAERGTAVETAALTDPTPTERSPAESPRVSAPPAGPPGQAPRSGVDELSYFNRLEQPNPPVEELAVKATPPPAPAKPERPQPAPPPPVREPVAAPAAVATASGATATSASAPKDTATQPFAVQIAALNVRSEADAMAKRLSSKGYAAFVLPPANGTPAVYRVRIGPFNTRREADNVAVRLQKEEQFKPWVTR